MDGSRRSHAGCCEHDSPAIRIIWLEAYFRLSLRGDLTRCQRTVNELSSATRKNPFPTKAKTSCWWNILDASDEREPRIIYDVESECLTPAPPTRRRCVNVFVYNSQCFEAAFAEWENVALHVASRKKMSRESSPPPCRRAPLHVAGGVWHCVYSVVLIQTRKAANFMAPEHFIWRFWLSDRKCQRRNKSTLLPMTTQFGSR